MTETVGEGADIVERLYWVSIHGDQMQAILIMEEAAKEIKRLREDLATSGRIEDD